MRYLKPNAEMLLKAMEFYGLEEVPGEKDNPIILDWFSDLGFNWVQDDETAWCSCFINWVALKCGCERSFELTARSWLRIGEETVHPEVGDIVVFWREHLSGWKGHVGLFTGFDTKGNIYTLGGNQDNKVNIKLYDKDRLLSYRKLRNA